MLPPGETTPKLYKATILSFIKAFKIKFLKVDTLYSDF